MHQESTRMIDLRWEVGSEFDWREEFVRFTPSPSVLPAGGVLFASGHGALLALGRTLRRNGRRLVLHLPSYYCMEVVSALRPEFDLAWYHDVPTEPSPDFDTLCPTSGDAVLAVNLFGLRNGADWAEWMKRVPNALLIEDHTHAPSSRWARQSGAHYAVASLRKTLPIPDGATLWSPRGLPVPLPNPTVPDGSYLKLTAMVLKGAHLRGAPVPKEAYRELQISGEQMLLGDTGGVATEFTRCILPTFDLNSLANQRTKNVRRLVRLIQEDHRRRWEPLDAESAAGGMNFNAILLCEDAEVRDRLRQFLIGRNVFCSVHWPQPAAGLSSGDRSAIGVSHRLLTVPVDQRYEASDIQRVAEILADFLHRL
jgi:hypothetical protein